MTIAGRENVKRTNPEAGSHRTLGRCGSKTGKVQWSAVLGKRMLASHIAWRDRAKAGCKQT